MPFIPEMSFNSQEDTTHVAIAYSDVQRLVSYLRFRKAACGFFLEAMSRAGDGRVPFWDAVEI